jgi:phosphatidylglycerol:prolipoprotein diacylglycerol transferase
MHPVLVHFGHLTLPTFGVLAALGLLFGLLLSERTARLAALNPEQLWDAGLFAMLAAFVLSRALLVVGHWRTFVAFPVLLLAVPSLTAPGLLLTGIATLVWFWWRGIDLRRAMEAWAPCGLLVWGFLALGHFAEGSDPGMTTDLRFGVRTPGMAGATHPVGLYVCLVAWGLAILAFRRVGRGDAAATALIGAGAAQFLISFVRQPGLETVLGLDALEWVAVGMMLAGGVLGVSARCGGASSDVPDTGNGAPSSVPGDQGFQ